jgi:Zn-dependent protease with chaperone function
MAMILVLTAGSFGVAFLLGWGLNALALIPWRRAAGTHCTERARRLFPPRISAAINLWLIAANVAVALQVWLSNAAYTWLSPAAAAWFGAALSGYTMDRIIWPGLSFKNWFGQFLIYVTFWQVGFLFTIVGILAMPPHFGWQAWAVAALLLALLLSLMCGLTLAFLRWTRLVRPTPPHVHELALRAAERVRAKLRATWVNEGPAAHAFALLPMRHMLFSASLLRLLSDDELASICAHEAAHLAESRWVVAGRVLGGLALYPTVFLSPVSHQFGSSGLLGLFAVTVLLIIFPRRLARRMEKRADASAVQQTTDPAIYARALEKLYETNQMPAVMPKRKHSPHPDLYDRMVAAGATPGYARPKPPRGAALTSFLLAVVFGLQIGMMIPRPQVANSADAAQQRPVRRGDSVSSLPTQSPGWRLLSSEVSTNNSGTNTLTH